MKKKEERQSGGRESAASNKWEESNRDRVGQRDGEKQTWGKEEEKHTNMVGLCFTSATGFYSSYDSGVCWSQRVCSQIIAWNIDLTPKGKRIEKGETKTTSFRISAFKFCSCQVFASSQPRPSDGQNQKSCIHALWFHKTVREGRAMEIS